MRKNGGEEVVLTRIRQKEEVGRSDDRTEKE
jgi:hypothetical protein